MNARKSFVTFTRPANVTPYTAGDAVGSASAILEFAGIAPKNGKAENLMITSASLLINAAAVPVGMGGFRLHLYDAAPAAIADNAAWPLTFAGDAPKYLGYIEFSAPSVTGAIIYSQADGLNKQIGLPEGTTSVWGILETRSAYTPANGNAYTVALHTIALQ